MPLIKHVIQAAAKLEELHGCNSNKVSSMGNASISPPMGLVLIERAEPRTLALCVNALMEQSGFSEALFSLT